MVEFGLLISDELYVEVVSVQVGAWGSILTRDGERERAVLEIFSREHRPPGTGTVTAALVRDFCGHRRPGRGARRDANGCPL